MRYSLLRALRVQKRKHHYRVPVKKLGSIPHYYGYTDVPSNTQLASYTQPVSHTPIAKQGAWAFQFLLYKTILITDGLTEYNQTITQIAAQTAGIGASEKLLLTSRCWQRPQICRLLT